MTGYYVEDKYATKCAVKLFPIAGNIFRIVLIFFYYYVIYLLLLLVYAMSTI